MSGAGINRSAYARIAPQWDAARSRLSPAERRSLDAVVHGLPAAAPILDLGCGTGRPIAAALLARGFRVTGVDQVPELLAIASARLPGGEWIESRIEAFAPRESPAAVILWDVLFHLDRAAHAPMLARVAQWLPAGGRVMLSSGGSAHPPFTDVMFGETFFYDSLPPDELGALLPTVGLSPVLVEILNEPDGGRDKGRIAIVAEAIPPRSRAS